MLPIAHDSHQRPVYAMVWLDAHGLVRMHLHQSAPVAEDGTTGWRVWFRGTELGHVKRYRTSRGRAVRSSLDWHAILSCPFGSVACYQIGLHRIGFRTRREAIEALVTHWERGHKAELDALRAMPTPR